MKHLKFPGLSEAVCRITVNERLKFTHPSKEPCLPIERCHIRACDAPF